VVRFAFPADAKLAIATYQWDLAIYCDSAGSNSLDRPLVRKGRIQRVAPPQALQRDLTMAKTPLEQASLYAKYGIWYDALTTLGIQLHSAQKPNQAILDAWRELLQQQKLTTSANSKS
jgi:hypothetical protein